MRRPHIVEGYAVVFTTETYGWLYDGPLAWFWTAGPLGITIVGNPTDKIPNKVWEFLRDIGQNCNEAQEVARIQKEAGQQLLRTNWNRLRERLRMSVDDAPVELKRFAAVHAYLDEETWVHAVYLSENLNVAIQSRVEPLPSRAIPFHIQYVYDLVFDRIIWSNEDHVFE